MEPQTLSAEVRDTSGKGPARQLRNSGLIPAILYGPGNDPVKLTISPTALAAAVSSDYGRNQLLEVTFGDRKELALVKDLAINPVTRELLHADLYRVTRDRPVNTNVAFHTKGRAVGVQRGGTARKLFRELPVRALPHHVPSSITLDISTYDIGTIIRAQDLVLPAGVEVTFAPTRRVFTLESKKEIVEEEAAAT